MTLKPDDVPAILTALGGFITVVGGFIVQTIMMMRQNRKLDSNHAETVNTLNEIKTSATGNFKALSEKP